MAIDWIAVRQQLSQAEKDLAEVFNDNSDTHRELLLKRTALLARPKKKINNDNLSYQLRVNTGGASYLLRLADLARTELVFEWTPLPGADKRIVGVIKRQGKIWVITDLHGLVSEQPGPQVKAPIKICLLKNTNIALRVDEIEAMQEMATHHFENQDFIDEVSAGIWQVDLEQLIKHPIFQTAQETPQ